MNLSSLAFENSKEIPAKYTCDGENVNPPLTISDIPENVQSLVLIVHDPDAVSGDFVHWLMWNINPKISEIAEDNVPADAVEGVTDFGESGYGGPCPPSGLHRYMFELSALDTKLELPTSTNRIQLEQAMQNHVLVATTLIGRYQRRD